MGPRAVGVEIGTCVLWNESARRGRKLQQGEEEQPSLDDKKPIILSCCFNVWWHRGMTYFISVFCIGLVPGRLRVSRCNEQFVPD